MTADTFDVAEFLTQRLIGRLAAVLFMVSGVVVLASAAVPREGRNVVALVVLGMIAVVAGGVCWRLPWQRWPKRATLPLVPVSLALIGAGGFADLRMSTFGVYFVVVFVWVGVAQPQWTSLVCTPLAVAAYLGPVLYHGADSDAVAAAGVVLPVCILVGEALSWISGRLRDAERLDLRRMVDMEALLDATVALARQDHPTGAANLVAEQAVRLLRADAAVVLLADGEGVLRGSGGHRWQGRVQALEARWLDQPARAALTSGDVTVHDGGVVGQLTRASKGCPALFVPVLGASGALGVVMVCYSPGTRIELDGFASGLARTFATQVSLAFQRLHATQVLLDASMRDALTGVGNRRQADALLAGLKAGDAVILLDLDHFKAVNDRYGHAAGDEVLAGLAGFLDRSLRDGDAIARFGGEEFVIVMRQAGDNAKGAVERLAAWWRATDPVTTFSAGVAVHAPGAKPEATLALADRALYRAKEEGRDRTCLEGEPPTLQEVAPVIA